VDDNNIKAHAKAYGRVPLWWIVSLRASGAGIMARDVLVVIASYAEKKTGQAWPAVETIAETLGVSRRAIQRAIAELGDVGILRITRRNRRKRETNVYRLVWKSPHQVNESVTYNEAVSGERGVHVNGQRDDFYSPEELAARGPGLGERFGRF
jgi:biotin operon repressor